MNKQYISGMLTGILMMICIIFGFALASINNNIFGQQTTPTPPVTATTEALPTETFPPSSPLPSITPANTLLPPPTFEPPTATLSPSQTPTLTPTAELRIDVPPPEGLQGLSSPTAEGETEVGCSTRSPSICMHRLGSTHSI